jgi:hypothetical protein
MLVSPDPPRLDIDRISIASCIQIEEEWAWGWPFILKELQYFARGSYPN